MTRAQPVLGEGDLILRMGETEDIPAIIRFYEANAEHLRPTDPPRPAGFNTEAYWERQVRLNHEDFLQDRSCRMFVFERADNATVIGTVNFSSFVRGPFQACLLGYCMDGREEGKGRMSRALRLGLGYAFGELRLHRVMANYLPTNVRSGAVLRRLGFVIEGYAPDYLFINGRWQDHILTALTNPDWRREEPPF